MSHSSVRDESQGIRPNYKIIILNKVGIKMIHVGNKVDRNKINQYVYDQVADSKQLKKDVDAFIENNKDTDMDYIIDWYFKDIREKKENEKYLSFPDWFQKYMP